MSTASEIIEKIRGARAAGIQCGYAIFPDGHRVLFPAARILSEKRNKDYRCTKMVGEYPDGSRIYFSWSENMGSAYSTEEFR